MPKLMRQTVNEVYAERDNLKAINTDLLAALETTANELDNQSTLDADGEAALDQARAAIAKARTKED
jgi:hypothetical protein